MVSERLKRRGGAVRVIALPAPGTTPEDPYCRMAESPVVKLCVAEVVLTESVTCVILVLAH